MKRRTRLAALAFAVPTALAGQAQPGDVVDPKPVLRIGQVMGSSEAYAFTDIGGIVVIGDSILVLEPSADEIRVFDGQGAFLGRIGRQGEGPGEFEWPTDMRRVPEGIAVVDLKLRRQSLFSPKGDLIRTELLGQLPDRPLAGSASLRGGGVLAETEVTMSAETGAFPERLLLLMDSTTQHTDTIARYSTGYVPYRAPDSYGFLGSAPLAGSEGRWAVAGDSLLVVVSGEPPAVRWWRADGGGLTPEGHVALPLQSVPFTRADERDLVEKTNAQRRADGEPALPRSTRVEAPDYWGQVKRLVISDRRVCWIQWNEPRKDVDPVWFRLDLRTRTLDRVTLPAGFRMLAAAGRNLYGYMLSEMDTPVVTVYRLRQGGG